MILRSLTMLSVAMVAFLMVGCDDDDDDNLATQTALLLLLQQNQNAASALTTIPTTASVEGFNSLVSSVQAAGLVDTLSSDGPFTVFAPTDSAFAALTMTPADLADVLTYHVTSGRQASTDVVQASGYTMVNGDDTIIDMVGETVYVNEARVTRTDILSSNGVIHEIDTVIMPPVGAVATLQNRGFSTLVDLVVRLNGLRPDLNLVATLNAGNYTLFAPTNAAFAAAGVTDVSALTDAEALNLLNAILYHVVPNTVAKASVAVAAGAVPTLLGSTRTVTVSVGASGPIVTGETNAPGIASINIPATGSAGSVIVHVIDGVLLPGTIAPTGAG